MKRSVCLVIGLLGLARSFGTEIIINPFQYSLNTSLIGHWKLDEASGTRVDNDPTGTAHNLTDVNTVAQTTGKIGSAALFVSANSEVLSEADTVDMSMGDIDMSAVCWANFTSVAGSQDLVGHWGSSPNRGWVIRYNSATGKGSFVVSNDGTATTTLEATAFGNLTTGIWYMFFVAHDSVNNVIKLSINNSAVVTTAHTTGIFNTTSAFTIGANAVASYYNGAIDEVSVWKKVLTAEEVTRLYNNGNGLTCCSY